MTQIYVKLQGFCRKATGEDGIVDNYLGRCTPHSPLHNTRILRPINASSHVGGDRKALLSS
ncbi:hypothetical protein K469DRAFT_711822 [Zopfia rhizophila CBS 207.26]|uniref:Uncharacterized protein n=1 Tax=Zopfia rhizophila CBS 207.26 TaxID=1314779 RepID=A0A6A6DYG5_9PEZI|nr:hypothetical protein K469DRAFT_711822 [Zopfia rhizophila CBS 207.26]